MAPFEQAQVRGTVLAAFSNQLEGLTRYRVMKEMKPPPQKENGKESTALTSIP